MNDDDETVFVLVIAPDESPERYRLLAKQLGTHGRVKCVVFARDTTNIDVTHLAERGVGLLAEKYKSSKLVLVGWSFGGVVAYEIGKRLLQMGERAVRVCLLDSFTPESVQSFIATARIEEKIEKITHADFRPDPSDPEAVMLRKFRAASEYCPTRFCGDVLFVRATHDDDLIASSEREWAKWIDGKFVHRSIDCTHNAMLLDEMANQTAELILNWVRA